MENDINYLMNSIDKLISLQQFTVGAFITIILAFVSVVAIVQYKLSEKQIKTLKHNIEKDMVSKYSLDKVSKIEKDLKYTYVKSSLKDADEALKKGNYFDVFLSYNSALDYLDETDYRSVFEYIIAVNGTLSIMTSKGIEEDSSLYPSDHYAGYALVTLKEFKELISKHKDALKKNIGLNTDSTIDKADKMMKVYEMIKNGDS